MPRLRTMAYFIAAGVILACSLLWSRAVASPLTGTDGARRWGEGPNATIPPVVNLTVDLQRPNSPPPSLPWAVPVTLSFSQPNGPVLYLSDVTLDQFGKWNGSITIPTGTYDVRLRNLHTLTNVKRAVTIAATNNLYMGTLAEGDADADNRVRASDFAILRAAYFSNEGDPCNPPRACWDPRADFDEDNRIRASDFALLALNYFKTGDIEVGLSPNPAADALAEAANAPALDIVAIRPESKSVQVGDTFTLDVMFEGNVPVVSADVQMLFDTNFLQLVSVTKGAAADAYFIDNSDPAAGKIWFGGGSLGAKNPPFTFATLKFKAKTNLGITHLGYNAAETDVEGVYGTVLDKRGLVEANVTIGPHIKVKPHAADVQECASTLIEVWLNEVSSANSADIKLAFNPAKLMVVDQDPALAGAQIMGLNSFLQPDSVTANIACNTLEPANPACDEATEVGTIHYAFTQNPPHAPVSGSGAIAQITVRPVGNGTSPLDITSSVVRDGTGAPIAHFDMSSSLVAVALGTPTSAIQALNTTTARLSWPPAISGASSYRIFESPTAPFFTPAEPAYGTSATLEFDDGSALGSPDTHSFYVVKAACPDAFTPNGYSNRIGAWNYKLVKGN